jgi:hypothetical protein
MEDRDRIIIHDFTFEIDMVITVDSSNAIFAYLVKKMAEITKNDRENGNREDIFWIKSSFNKAAFFRSSIFYNNFVKSIVTITIYFD